MMSGSSFIEANDEVEELQGELSASALITRDMAVVAVLAVAVVAPDLAAAFLIFFRRINPLLNSSSSLSKALFGSLYRFMSKMNEDVTAAVAVVGDVAPSCRVGEAGAERHFISTMPEDDEEDD